MFCYCPLYKFPCDKLSVAKVLPVKPTFLVTKQQEPKATNSAETNNSNNSINNTGAQDSINVNFVKDCSMCHIIHTKEGVATLIRYMESSGEFNPQADMEEQGRLQGLIEDIATIILG